MLSRGRKLSADWTYRNVCTYMYTFLYIYIYVYDLYNICISYIYIHIIHQIVVEDPQYRGQEDPSTGPAFWPFTLRNSDLASVGTSLAKLTGPKS